MADDGVVDEDDRPATVGDLVGDLLSLAEPDLLLQAIQASANGSTGSIGVSLTVGGHLISGLLVGGRTYFERLADELESADRSDVMVAVLREQALTYPAGDSEPDDEDSQDPTYVHLVDAWILGRPATKIGFWRGRLSHVSGWSLGVFEPPNQS